MNRREEVVSAYDALPQDAFKDREPSARDLVARAIALTEVCNGLAAALDDVNLLGRETIAAWTEARLMAIQAQHHILDRLEDAP